MHDTGKIEQPPLIGTCATMYSVYFSRLTRLTCRYHVHLSPVSGNFRKQAPRAGNELYVFVGDVPVSGRVSPQYVTPYVQCAGCRGRAKVTPRYPLIAGRCDLWAIGRATGRRVFLRRPGLPKASA
jgi:hypothetical protein